MWTRFWDMNSGGGQKEPFEMIFVEAPAEEAALIFTRRFGHDPHRVTCLCCGPDYAIDGFETLEAATRPGDGVGILVLHYDETAS